MSASDATDATSESHTESKQPTPKPFKTERRSDQSLLMRQDDISDSVESSIEDDSSAMGTVQVNSSELQAQYEKCMSNQTLKSNLLLQLQNRKHVRSKRRRQISESNGSSSNYEVQKPGPKRFKLVMNFRISMSQLFNRKIF